MQALTADNLGTILDELTRNAARWASTPLSEQVKLLQRLRDETFRLSERWVEVCCRIKGIDPRSATAGQEWGVGPMIVLRNLRLLQARVAKGNKIVSGYRRTLPTSLADVAQWPGLYAETWTGAPSGGEASQPGKVSLVLGAGNVSSISATDVIYKLFVERQVVLLKMNPVHEPLGPILEEAFGCLVEAGVLRVVSGDGEAGGLACRDPRVDNIHVTGATRTFEAIRDSLPQPKPITAELGCVSPVLVFPGQWTAGDLAYQARHVAGMLTTNAGFNCNAAQVLVTSKNWPQRSDFLSELRQALHRVPPRVAYYPGAGQRYESIVRTYPQAEALGANPPGCLPWTLVAGIDPSQSEKAFQEEAFCGVLHEVALDNEPDDFLDTAAEFVNKRVWGNLSCTLLIDPASLRTQPWRAALRKLHYGAIGVNVWAGLVFALVELPWGAAPGNTPQNISSGVGHVHNTAGVENPAKAVLSGPFRTPYFPPWHAGHPRLLQIGRALSAFEYRPSWMSLLTTHFHVLVGSLPWLQSRQR